MRGFSTAVTGWWLGYFLKKILKMVNGEGESDVDEDTNTELEILEIMREYQNSVFPICEAALERMQSRRV